MINLKEVLSKYPECLSNSEKLRAYLTDLYPSERADINIIVTIFSCGIADEIKNNEIDSITIQSYCRRLENEFGFSTKITEKCINLWLDAYEKETSSNSKISSETYTIKNDKQPPQFIQSKLSKKATTQQNRDNTKHLNPTNNKITTNASNADEYNKRKIKFYSIWISLFIFSGLCFIILPKISWTIIPNIEWLIIDLCTSFSHITVESLFFYIVSIAWIITSIVGIVFTTKKYAKGGFKKDIVKKIGMYSSIHLIWHIIFAVIFIWFMGGVKGDDGTIRTMFYLIMGLPISFSLTFADLIYLL